jgi:hypothetical protein
VYMKVGHVNLIGTRGLRRNSNVMIAPAMPRDRVWRFVVLSQIFMQSRNPLSL